MNVRHLTLAVATTAALVLPATPGHAADTIEIPAGQTSCPDGYVCLFRDYDFQGGGYGVRSGDSLPWLGDLGFNDQMSSWANDSGRTYCWYSDASFAGERHVMQNGYRVNVLPRENDTASSLAPC
ncbi:peptidase inhibitor family I36 protein [Nonomuraea sp. MG754425]|uniref:peptidase inhibitor family I36 protein n=1 Tax=Nonomuraea sp. MG754425 TaxID=2570319 RepID=UPI001F483E5C|nr:peptidase inhibitor family I36 protein [Nonomuraea sp. MG754425]